MAAVSSALSWPSRPFHRFPIGAGTLSRATACTLPSRRSLTLIGQRVLNISPLRTSTCCTRLA
eukprot:14523479-Alexandrium_andersonii.AAC.1